MKPDEVLLVASIYNGIVFVSGYYGDEESAQAALREQQGQGRWGTIVTVPHHALQAQVISGRIVPRDPDSAESRSATAARANRKKDT